MKSGSFGTWGIARVTENAQRSKAPLTRLPLPSLHGSRLPKKTLFPSIVLSLCSTVSSLSVQLPVAGNGAAHAQIAGAGRGRGEGQGGQAPPPSAGLAPPPSAGPCRSAARSRSPAPGGSSGPRLAAPLSLLLARRCRLFCKGALHLIFQPFCENQCCDKEGRNRPFSLGLRLNCPCAGNRTGPCSRSLRVMLEPDVSLQCDVVREKIKIPLGKDAQLQAETLRSSLLVNGPCRINVSGSQAWFPLWGPREQRLPWRERGSGAAGPISPRAAPPAPAGDVRPV